LFNISQQNKLCLSKLLLFFWISLFPSM
jgi:hypothetical protein